MKNFSLRCCFLSLSVLLSVAVYAQQTPPSAALAAVTNSNAEDSLDKGWSSFLKGTTIGGYGNLRYQKEFNYGKSYVNLERFTLFIGHKFSKRISFFSELELEDAKVEGGKVGGEITLEQAYLKFSLNPNNYIVMGLFLPRIGILNENHLPTTFLGNERTQVETLILPATWREIGIGYYGTARRIPLTYSIGITNGLNAGGFEHGTGIREGRYEGQFATMNNLAVTAALQYNKNGFRAQLSGYYGGSMGYGKRAADSLRLTSGIFGTPVAVGEADVMYSLKGFSARILAAVVAIPNASEINRAFASNTPNTMYGAYAEVGYNIFEEIKKLHGHQLIVFVRYEKMDINAAIPSNGLIDGTLNQQHITTGLSYLPLKNVVIKADVRFTHTGNANPDLVINPNPAAPVYRLNDIFLNIGVGYSF